MQSEGGNSSPAQSAIYDWLRWVILAPAAMASHELVLSLYPPVGRFLGGYFGYFWPWTYKLAFLILAFVATLLAVYAAMVIAPSNKKVVGIIVGGSAIAYACVRLIYFWNPLWSAGYAVLYAVSVVAGAAVPYFFALAFNDLLKDLLIGTD